MNGNIMNSIVLISGGFDPLHSGHIAMIEEAGKYGKIVVLLNSDKWLINKKGKFFLPFKERSTIMLAIKNVVDVIEFNDSDKTCIDGIRKAVKKYSNIKIKIANGGDRNIETIPISEKEFCKKNRIESLWKVGGDFKKNSSSLILKRWKK